MSTYGFSHYGPPTLYGRDRPITVVPGGGALPPISNAYLIDPFTAVAVDYRSVLLTWTTPDASTATPMTEFRLLSNRYGFPVDENDGNTLIDTAVSPGSSYLDQNVVPGQMTYYGFYISTGSAWVRAGFSACLVPTNYGYASSLLSYLPEYLRDVEAGELTADSAGNPYLYQFLSVAGFSLDYLKTQYDFLFNNQNAPLRMAFSDLADLAGQLGMPFSGEIPAYFLRKAVDNWTTVMRQRGTLAGVAEHIELLSGYGADVQLARNIMLEDDQSAPDAPNFAPWSAGIPYAAGELVTYPSYPQWVISGSYVADNYVEYNGVCYQCTAAVSGVPPTGASNSGTYWAVASGPFVWERTTAVTSLPVNAPGVISGPGTLPEANTGWQLVYDQDSTTSYLSIPGLVGGVSTWEVLTASGATPHAAGVASGSLVEGIGIRNPANWQNDFSQNSFRVENRSGAATDQWFRSVSRQASDITNGSTVPDPQLVIEHGIPVPQAGDAWNSGTRYPTGSVVSYNGLNYLALRASTGATPPTPGSTSPEWVQIGNDSRVPLVISAETSQDWSVTATEQYAITPFAEFYDSWGNLITRAFARTPTAGTAGTPNGYTYDSFTTNPGSSLTGRETDTGDQAWVNPTGSWVTDGSGSAYPTTAGKASVWVTTPLSCTQAVTFTAPAPSGWQSGLAFWSPSSSSNYWVATMTGLYYGTLGGTMTEAATYTTPLQAGDRIYVVTNQATPEITVYRNIVGAYSAGSGNGQVAQISGASVPTTYLPGGGATVYSGLAVIPS